jgi:hypothetical protein
MNTVKVMLVGATLAGLLGPVASLPARGQSSSHSISSPSTYLENRTLIIEGMVVRFRFRDPHSLVYVMVPDKQGNMVTWVAEWRAARSLSAEQIDRNTLRVGDYVVVTGNPASEPRSHSLRVKAIERPADGWMWVGIAEEKTVHQE